MGPITPLHLPVMRALAFHTLTAVLSVWFIANRGPSASILECYATVAQSQFKVRLLDLGFYASVDSAASHAGTRFLASLAPYFGEHWTTLDDMETRAGMKLIPEPVRTTQLMLNAMDELRALEINSPAKFERLRAQFALMAADPRLASLFPAL